MITLKKKAWVFGVLLFLSMIGSEVQAHHGGGGGSQSLSVTQAARLTEPQTQFYLTFEMDFLDNSLGEVYSYGVVGEYAFSKRFSLAANLPFESIRMDLLPHSDQLGDMRFLAKGVVWVSSSKLSGLNLGLEMSLPTGNDTLGRGAGVVTLSPYLSFITKSKYVEIFAYGAYYAELARQTNPTLNFELAFRFPLLKKTSPSLSFVTATRGWFVFNSDTFETGSLKVYQGAGFLMEWERFSIDVMGRFSWLDTLDFREDVTADDLLTGLLVDVQASLVLGVGFQF